MQTSLPGFAPEFQWVPEEVLSTRSHGKVRLRRTLVTTVDELERMVARLEAASHISYDTETSGLNPHLGARVIGHAFACWGHQKTCEAWYVPIRHIDPTCAQLPVDVVTQAVARVLGSDGRVVLHHAKFDKGMVRADGISPTWKRKLDDTSIRAVICNENETSFGLKQLGTKYVLQSAANDRDAVDEFMRKDARSLKLPYKKRRAGEEHLIEPVTYMERFGHQRVPAVLEGAYACGDVFLTLALYDVQEPEIQHYPQTHARELAISEILHEMEWNGLPSNVDEIRDAQVKADAERAYWLGEIRRLLGDPGFEPTDNNVRELFFGRLKMQPPKDNSVDAETRMLLAARYPEYEPIINAISTHAKIQKIASTYGAAFLRHYSPVTGCIHPSYNQLEERDEGGVPVTGRLSSQAPNIQNIAKKPIKLRDGSTLSVRRYFYVPAGYVRVYIDFSQIELRVLAWYSRDPVLLDCYANDRDVHTITAREVTNGDRDVAKQVNFGNSYGMTEMGLAKRMAGYAKDPDATRKRAKVVLDNFFTTYAGIPRFRDEFAAHMKRNGCRFVNAFGRPRRIEAIASPREWEADRAKRMMMSSIISGTAADLMKESMIRLYTWFKRDNVNAILRQTIHDEVVIDIKIEPGWEKVLYQCQYLMTHWPMFEEKGVPIRAGIAATTTTWEKKKTIEVFADGTIQVAA